MIRIQKQTSAAEAEIVTPGLIEGVPQRLILIIERQILPKPLQIHFIYCAVRQINFLITFLTDGHILDFRRKQTWGRIAADGAHFFVVAE